MTLAAKADISVIIPAFNADRYLAEAIDSALYQEILPQEIIVIDDGSTDQTAAVCRQYASVSYHYQPNQGIGAARNQGIALARGTLLAFLDADDVWMPQKLGLQLAAIERNPDLDLVFGHVAEFFSPELEGKLDNKLRPPSSQSPGFIPSTLLARRTAFDRAGMFETNWRMGEFMDWYLRALELGLQKELLPELVARRRLHDANNGIRQRQAVSDYARILKESLDRRRLGNTLENDR
jgi:glycosyltransferase involved in cell wall biosynthesis